MFDRELQSGRLVRAFELEVCTGSYWLTWLKSKRLTPAMQAFRTWIAAEAAT